MQPYESIFDLQIRFTQLTNNLMTLGKYFKNYELNLKVLISLMEAWKSKVMAISEKKSRSKMYYAALFDKLQEHEIDLERLEKYEENEKNSKIIALKTKIKIYDSN